MVVLHYFIRKITQQLITMRETVLHSIFLDLRKAYNYLDRYQCLDILAGYGVGPRTLCILQTYWVRIQMTEKVRGNYGPVLQSHCRVTQGKPLSPTIFNMVVDTVIQQCVTVVGVP